MAEALDPDAALSAIGLYLSTKDSGQVLSNSLALSSFIDLLRVVLGIVGRRHDGE